MTNEHTRREDKAVDGGTGAEDGAMPAALAQVAGALDGLARAEQRAARPGLEADLALIAARAARAGAGGARSTGARAPKWRAASALKIAAAAAIVVGLGLGGAWVMTRGGASSGKGVVAVLPGPGPLDSTAPIDAAALEAELEALLAQAESMSDASLASLGTELDALAQEAAASWDDSALSELAQEAL